MPRFILCALRRHQHRELKERRRCGHALSDTLTVTAGMAVLRPGPQACGPGFQWLLTRLPVGLRNCVRATESGARSASRAPLPLSPVEGSEPGAVVPAGLLTGTCALQAPQGPGPAPSAVHGETVRSSFCSLENQSFLIIARWQPMSSAGR